MSDTATLQPGTPAAEAARRRTFAIISHPDAGKTTLTEHLLLLGGAIRAAGQVKARGEARRARSDWMKIEQERGISVTSAVMTFEYGGAIFNLLDTPGHEDFSEDTYRTLTAADSAVMVIDAAKGIEAQTRKLFEVCRLRDIPIVTFVNKMDREARDPIELLDEIADQLQLECVPMNWPAGMGLNFRGIYDLAANEFVPFAMRGDHPGRVGRGCVGERPQRGRKDPARRRGRTGARRQPRLRSRHLSRRPSEPGLFRLGAQEFRRHRTDQGAGGLCAAAARADCQDAHRRARRKRRHRLRLQGPGEHGPQPPRPHRLPAAGVGQVPARHEAQAVRHRQGHRHPQSDPVLRPGARDGR